MVVEDATRQRQSLAVAKLDRLRKLDDGPAWEILDHALAEPLWPRPHIPEIAAAVQKYETVRAALGEVVRVVVAFVAAVRDADAGVVKPRQLAEPDGAVAHVGRIRKADQRTFGVAADDRGECGSDAVAQRDQRLPSFEIGRAFCDQHAVAARCTPPRAAAPGGVPSAATSGSTQRSQG